MKQNLIGKWTNAQLCLAILLSIINRTHKVSKDILDLETQQQLIYLTNIYRTFHPKIVDHTIFSSVQ